MKNKLLLLLLLTFPAGIGAQEIKKMKMDELLHFIDTSSNPLVINFWASWCGPCIREIPWFEKNISKYAAKKISLVLVSIDFPDEYPANLTAFVKKQGYHSKLIWLNETNSDEFCPKIDKSWDGAIPATLMVNRKTKYRQFYKQQLPELKLLEELDKLAAQ